MLTRFEPFRELDRLFGATMSAYRGMPTDVYRRGDEYFIEFDLPGLQPDSIDVTVEGNVLQVSAERKPRYGQDDQVILSERPTGSVRRQLHLGNDVDGNAIEASYQDGVLALRVPVAEQAKPHKIQIGSGTSQKSLTANAA